MIPPYYMVYLTDGKVVTVKSDSIDKYLESCDATKIHKMEEIIDEKK